MTSKDVGKIFYDAKGAGRIYIPKNIADLLQEAGFKNKDQIITEFNKETKTLTITKF